MEVSIMLVNRARARLMSRAAGRVLAGLGACAALVLIILWSSACERKTVEDYLAAGDQAMRDSKLPQAEAAYQSAIQAAPNDPRTHIALGNLYVFEQKPGPAQLEFMKVLELDPKNAPAHAALANLYMGQNQFGMAEAQYRAAIVLDPTRVNYHLTLGSALIKENKLSDAEAEIRTAIGLDPKNAQAHLALANLLNSEPGRATEAQAELAQARALDPHLVPPPAPEATPAESVASAGPSGPAVKIKPLDRKFLLTHDSQVYENPDSSSSVVGHVHKRGFVHVTGISGDWFQIKLRSGVVGFIPVSTAE
jgi:tetratricopeptide (TPR) repeat protein